MILLFVLIGKYDFLNLRLAIFFRMSKNQILQ